MTLLDNVLLGTYSRTKTGLLAGALRLNQAKKPAPATRRCGNSNASGSGDKPFELAGNLPLGNQRVLGNRPRARRRSNAARARRAGGRPARQEKLKLAELLRSLRSDHLTSCWSSTTWSS